MSQQLAHVPPVPNARSTVVEDMSAWLIAGQVSSTPRDGGSPTDYRTPAQGIDDGVEAEQLGLRRVFVAERLNFKDAAVILAGVGARTSRIGLATGLIPAATRTPQVMASLAATMQASFGDRFILGLGLGVPAYFSGLGGGRIATTPAGLADYVHILRRLWRGETVSYDGPAGSFKGLTFGLPYELPEPQVWYGTFANSQGAKAAAAAFDGVMLPSMLTPDATVAAVGRLRQACERIDRDPATLRIIQPVVTAPDLPDAEIHALAHGRAVTYLATKPYSTYLAASNGWDPKQVERIASAGHALARRRAMAAGTEMDVDWGFQRVELHDVAALVPDEWMRESCALGSIEECMSALQAYRDAGADEIGLYGSTASQNAGLIAAWRERSCEKCS
jgi:5,10-methylenetetrahydromethanopterin reductase